MCGTTDCTVRRWRQRRWEWRVRMTHNWGRMLSPAAGPTDCGPLRASHPGSCGTRSRPAAVGTDWENGTCRGEGKRLSTCSRVLDYVCRYIRDNQSEVWRVNNWYDKFTPALRDNRYFMFCNLVPKIFNCCVSYVFIFGIVFFFATTSGPLHASEVGNIEYHLPSFILLNI